MNEVRHLPKVIEAATTAANRSISIISPMRRWLLLFLLFVLPVQFAWAGVAHCYRFASTGAPQHVTQTAAADKVAEVANGLDIASEQAGTPSIDLAAHCECGNCHGTGVQSHVVAELAATPHHERPAAEPPDGIALELLPAIDRPRWNRAA